MGMPAQKPGKSKQDYGTPKDFIDAVAARFGPLVVDLAAHAGNAKCLEFITRSSASRSAGSTSGGGSDRV